MKTLYFLITGILLISANISTAQIAETNDIVPEQKIEATNSDDLAFIATRYYYYPNLDAYFDSKEGLFVYNENGQWLKIKEIPTGYRGYSIYNGMNFAVNDYNGDKPYTKIDEHRKQFPKKYTSRRQPPKAAKADSNVAVN